jgi:hypothetical protein
MRYNVFCLDHAYLFFRLNLNFDSVAQMESQRLLEIRFPPLLCHFPHIIIPSIVIFGSIGTCHLEQR